MYVCICNGHRDRDIKEAAKSGLTCARAIYRHLGKPVRCGRCLDVATQLVEEVHAIGDAAVKATDALSDALLKPAGETAAA